MACTVILTVRPKEGMRDTLVDTFRAILPDTRAFDGCLGVTVTQNMDDADSLVVIEQWSTRAHYEKYLAWRAERGDIDKLMGLLGTDPSFMHLEPLDA